MAALQAPSKIEGETASKTLDDEERSRAATIIQV
jgi:hypothetical protein